ncbi:hypothetical protein PAMA_002058 [Pampus argenteus]
MVEKGMDDHFRQSTRIGNAPERSPRDGRPVSPMSGERRMRLLAGSYMETWRERCSDAVGDYRVTDVIQRGPSAMVSE